jgi:hypothetical protein
MTITGITEEPLFVPQGGLEVGSTLIANIGGELSLWRVMVGDITDLRIYTADGHGYWLLSHIHGEILNDKKHGKSVLKRQRADTVLRHWDQIKVYAAMLGEELTDA